MGGTNGIVFFKSYLGGGGGSFLTSAPATVSSSDSYKSEYEFEFGGGGGGATASTLDTHNLGRQNKILRLMILLVTLFIFGIY